MLESCIGALASAWAIKIPGGHRTNRWAIRAAISYSAVLSALSDCFSCVWTCCSAYRDARLEFRKPVANAAVGLFSKEENT